MVIDINLIKNYINNNTVDNVVFDGTSINELVIDGVKIWHPCYKGHHESDWIIDKEPTNTEDGSRHKECTVCGAVSRTEVIIKYNALTYTLLNNGTYSVKKGQQDITGAIYIPSTYMGRSVTEVADNAFYNCDNITGVYLPDTITRIGDYAFFDCGSLSEVVLGTGVTSIGTYAFAGTTKLDQILIPLSVTYIGYWAFRYCAANLTIYCEAPSKPSGWDANWNPENRSVVWNYIYEYTLLSNDTYSIKPKEGATIPNDVVIPSTYLGRPVVKIADYAFSGYTNITSVTLPDSIITIGDYAFEGCSMLGTVNISENSQLTTIGHGAFYEVTEMVTMFLPDSLTTIGDEAFALSSIETLAIPDNVTHIGIECFKESWLRTITFGSNSKLSDINDYAFIDCYYLTGIEIPDSVIDINERAFYGCRNLGTVKFGNNLERIWDRAFAYSGLTTVTIPEGCRWVNDGAFSQCTNLAEINLPSTLVAVGEESASGVFNNTAYYNDPNNWTDGVLYIGEWLIDIKSTISYVEVASSCNSIGAGAISDRTLMAIIRIPLNVMNIQPKAFINADNVTIYCEATSKPDGWADNWCDDSVTVVWGYTGDINIHLVTEHGAYLTDEQGRLLII